MSERVLVGLIVAERTGCCVTGFLDDGFGMTRVIVHESKVVGMDRLKAAPKAADHKRQKKVRAK